MGDKERPLRVLVVEDEPLLGRLSVRALEGLGGMEAALAEDGREGLELAGALRPDVILLDLFLPVMSGVEFLRQYRQSGGRAKVVVVTGAGQERVKELVFSAGADFLLGKPLQWSEVLPMLRELVGGREEKYRTLLRDMGAPVRSKGFGQAARCAALLKTDSCGLLKEVYIEAAAQWQSRPECVSKNIERLVRELHRQGSPLYRKLTGRGPEDPAPTNREFLELLGQAVRIPL